MQIVRRHCLAAGLLVGLLSGAVLLGVSSAAQASTYVPGYYKRNGTYVLPHMEFSPNQYGVPVRRTPHGSTHTPQPPASAGASKKGQ
jgi:hypothetical protein